MKTLVMLALVALSVSCSANMVEYDLTKDSKQVQICLEKPVAGKVGVFAYTLLSSNWDETYIGLTYAPIPNVQLAYGIGHETFGNRTGGWIWAGKGKVSAIYLFEDGGCGPWTKTEVKIQTSPKLSLGYAEKSFTGGGLLAEYNLGKGVNIKLTAYKEPELAIKLAF